jgi:hypothetical protein
MTKPFIFLSKRSGAWAPRKTISAIRSSRSAPAHRLKMARPRALLLFATALLAPASLAHGQTILVGPGETATIPGTYASGTYDGGTVDLEGTLINDGSLDNESGGTLTNESGGTITNDGTLNNSGNLLEFGTIDNSDTLANNGSFQNDEGGTVANEDGGTITNNTYFYNLDATITNSGTINNDSGTGFVFENDGTLTNNSSRIINSDGTINNNGMLTNQGIISNNGNFINNAIFINETGGSFPETSPITLP